MPELSWKLTRKYPDRTFFRVNIFSWHRSKSYMFYEILLYFCSKNSIAYPQRVCQLGCFTDPGREAMRDEIVAYTNDQSNTVEKCLNTCTKKYYSHAGLSEG